ncbi:unannotated protein [freshwater metagenome]|uniref:Unannotated protein n=1 Tax=freshwater metagenome TaxID=449393 RepID=A0A6J6IY14_9ZZZZ
MDNGDDRLVEFGRSQWTSCVVDHDHRRILVDHAERGPYRVGPFLATLHRDIGGAAFDKPCAFRFLARTEHNYNVIGRGAGDRQRPIYNSLATEEFVLLRMGAIAPARTGSENDCPYGPIGRNIG